MLQFLKLWTSMKDKKTNVKKEKDRKKHTIKLDRAGLKGQILMAKKKITREMRK